MLIETRDRESGDKTLILIPETKAESEAIDEYLGRHVPVSVVGEVRLADGSPIPGREDSKGERWTDDRQRHCS